MPNTPTQITQDLRDLIRLTRTDVLGLSQRQAALAAGGMSQVWWRTIESGRVEHVPADTIARMAYALNITPEQLRNIGEDHVAGLVERRLDLLIPESPPDDTEAWLMQTPDTTEAERTSLVSFLRTMRQVKDETA